MARAALCCSISRSSGTTTNTAGVVLERWRDQRRQLQQTLRRFARDCCLPQPLRDNSALSTECRSELLDYLATGHFRLYGRHATPPQPDDPETRRLLDYLQAALDTSARTILLLSEQLRDQQASRQCAEVLATLDRQLQLRCTLEEQVLALLENT